MIKTVFIPAYHGFVSRAVFASDALRLLKEQADVRIVLFVPPAKREYMKAHFGGPNVIVEGFDPIEIVRAPYNKFWWRLAFLLQNSRYVQDQRRERLWRHRNLIGYLNYAMVTAFAVVASHIPFVYPIFRWLDWHLSPKGVWDPFIEKYQPSLFFATDLFSEADALFLRSARKHGIRTVGMVRSWDNTTTKGILRFIPDQVIVNSVVLKEEIVGLHGCPIERVSVVGTPQFDGWLSGPTMSREDFFRSIDVDPKKHLVLFAPGGTTITNIDWQLCQILQKSLDEDGLPGDTHFFIRNHPQHPADLSRFSSDARFTIEVPGSRVQEKDFKAAELSPSDNDHLRNLIYYSDVVMYIATSLGLDAAVFGKPQIIVSFDGYQKRPYVVSISRFNHEDCLARLITTGGTMVAESAEDWIRMIREYLEDPTKDEEGRSRIVERHLAPLDGDAGKRIGNIILEVLHA